MTMEPITLLYSNTTAAAALLLLIFLMTFHVRKYCCSKHITAPLAGGAWPIIGHLALLNSCQLPHITLGNMADKYGPIFSIRLGSKLALVVSNWEMAKEVFTTNDISISARPQLVAIKHLGYNGAMFSFSPYGPYWRQVRKISTLELLSARKIDLQSHVRVFEVRRSLKEIYVKMMNGSGQVLVDMRKWFGDLTFNVFLRLMCGKQYWGEIDQEETRRSKDAMREFFRLLGLFVVSDAIPWLGWMDFGGHVKAIKRTAKELDDIVGEWLEEKRRSNKRSIGTNEAEKDFMDVMLSILDGSKFEGVDADTVNKATTLILLAGGIDTSSVTLTWALSLLLNDKHALRKAQEELDTQVGRERAVEESDIDKLEYIQAIVKETLRLYPAAPLSGPRVFREDCTVAGYHVRKGTRLITNLWKIHRDPSVWPDPLDFKPERFLTTHKHVDVRGQNFELIPFGSGRRICPGITLALRMVHFALASVLHSFEISTPLDELVDMSETFGLTNMKATELEVVVKPRLASTFYENM